MAGKKRFLSTEVLIVGSGGAGLAAAIEAREAGARVIVIEQKPTLGGATIISGGGCFIVDSPLQRAQGIEDSPDLAFRDWIIWGEGQADEQWARFYIEHSLYDLYHWAEKMGVRWVALFHQEGNSVPRWHRPQDDGLGLWTALYNTARAKGIEQWLTSLTIKEILIEGGKAVGALAEHNGTGGTYEFRCKTLVMATGGFMSNLDMILEHNPRLKAYRVMEGSDAGAQGTGHNLIEGVGGFLTHMENIWLYAYATPDYKDPTGRRGLVIRGILDSIWVNAQGKRFHNESLYGGASATPALMAQNPPFAWAIIDSSMVKEMEVADPYYRQGREIHRERVQELLYNSPNIRKSDALSALAQKIDLEPEVLQETIGRYNRFIEQGLDFDPDFHRPLKGRRRIEHPPFYAIQFFLLARKSLGGVKTNLRCQVLDRHFNIIPGLYACGELAGMAGGYINGKKGLEGTMLGPSILSGRVAGAWAAHQAGYSPGFVGHPNTK